MPGGLPNNPVSVIGSYAICCMANVAVTTTPQALAAPAQNVAVGGVEEILMQNDSASASVVLVGDSTNQTVQIAVGASLTLPMRDPTKVQVKTASGTATLHVLYRGQPS